MSIASAMLGADGSNLQQDDPRRIESTIDPSFQWYSETYGVSYDEAKQRHLDRITADDTILALKTLLPERFSYIKMQHNPEYRLLAAYTGTDEGLESVREAALKSPIPVDIIVGQSASERVLAARLDEVAEAAEGDADVKARYVGAGQIHIQVTGSSDPESLARQLTETFGFPVVVEADAAFEKQNYGGARVTNNNGGFSNLKCTTGFSVAAYSNGATGSTTAGHCPTNIDIWLNSITKKDTTNVAGGYAENSTTDAQWVSVPDPELKQFWTGSSSVTVTSIQPRISIALGEPVCHYGEGDFAGDGNGFSCAEVGSAILDPGDVCGPNDNADCAASWILANDNGSTVLDHSGGDSGGPWFYNNRAWGLHTAGSNLIPGGTAGTSAYFMAQDYLVNIGVYIWY